MQQTTTPATELAAFSRRGFLGLAGSVGIATFLAACTPGGGTPGGTAGTTQTMKVTLPSDVTLLLYSVDYLSEDLGYYKKGGIGIERVPFAGGPPAMQGLLSQAGNGNLQTPGEFLGVLAKNQPVKALMAHTNAIGASLVISKKFADNIGISADSSVAEKIAALGSVKGARYAITAPGSQTDGLTRLAVKRFGLNPDTETSIIPLQSAANNLPALENDRIDGFFAQSPVPEQAIETFGAVPMLSIARGDVEGAEKLAGVTAFARTSDVEDNPELYAAFIKANVQALKDLIDAPDEARDLLRKTRFEAIDEKIWSTVWENNLPIWRTPHVSADSLTAWIDQGLVAADAAPSPAAVSAAVESKFVDDAVAAIGWKIDKA